MSPSHSLLEGLLSEESVHDVHPESESKKMVRLCELFQIYATTKKQGQ